MEKNLVVSGKRKTSVAKATIKQGRGNVTINQKPISLFPYLKQLELNEPLLIAKGVLGNLNFDISVRVSGGGMSSRIEASRLAIARALLKFTKDDSLKNAYLSYDRNIIIADTRRKEARKPGDSKARAMRQSSYR